MLSVICFGQPSSPLRIQLSNVNYTAFTEPQEQLIIEKLIWKELYKNDAQFLLDQWYKEAEKRVGLQQALGLSEEQVAKLNAQVEMGDRKLNNLADNYAELGIKYEKQIQRKKNWRNKGIPIAIIIGFAGGYYVQSMK